MENFLHLDNINTKPALLSLYQNYDLFGQITIRQNFYNSSHKETQDIICRFNKITDPKTILDDIQCFDYPVYDKLSEIRRIVMWLMSSVGGEQLGRVLIVKLPVGCKIDSHTDGGYSTEFYDRFHIALQAVPGVDFVCEGELVNMVTGDVWWFNNSKEHAIYNQTLHDRIHLIVDIRTRDISGSFMGDK